MVADRADELATRRPFVPAAPETVLAETGAAEADTPETGEAETAEGDGAAKAEPYVPAFVPTKASRLAFLSNGKTVPRELPLPRRAADAASSGDGDQITLEEAIVADRATAFGSGMPADSTATQDKTADTTADAPADKVLEPVMVADRADELATRRPFVPAAPADMPDADAVPEATPAGGKTSLINKISGLWTSKAGEEESQARIEPAVETASEAEAQTAEAETAAPAAPTAPSILDLPRADAMSRMPEPASTTALDSQTDDLEIPAFLRRQAN